MHWLKDFVVGFIPGAAVGAYLYRLYYAKTEAAVEKAIGITKKVEKVI